MKHFTALLALCLVAAAVASAAPPAPRSHSKFSPPPTNKRLFDVRR